MAIKTLFALLVSILLGLSPALASAAPTHLNTCDAPAPDSFRVTVSGGDFATLAWIPAWPGALHTLSVSKKISPTEWQLLYTLHDIPGSTYTVDSLLSGTEYRFAIATQCNSGETSERTAYIDWIGAVVDLVIAGRIPINPIPVDCDNIPLNYNWKGFKVEYVDGEGLRIANYFEFPIQGDVVGNGNPSLFQRRIARTFLENHIVAVDGAGKWPDCEIPIKQQVPLPFKMRNRIESVDIGFVKFNQKTDPPSIGLCPDYNHAVVPWRAEYLFTAMVAHQATPPQGCNGLLINPVVNSGVKAQSPFLESLIIFLPEDFLENIKVECSLFNTNGQRVLHHRIERIASQITLPTTWLADGIYILQIKTGYHLQTLRVIKNSKSDPSASTN
jgi:hypothetical protein